MSFNNLSIKIPTKKKKNYVQEFRDMSESLLYKEANGLGACTDAESLQARKPQGHKAETISFLVMSLLLTLDDASKLYPNFIHSLYK